MPFDAQCLRVPPTAPIPGTDRIFPVPQVEQVIHDELYVTFNSICQELQKVNPLTLPPTPTPSAR